MLNGTADVDRIHYDYDYAGNRLYSDIDSAIYAGNNRDQAYSYDSGHRLQDFQQGTLSGGTISGTPVNQQQWGLDALGNWSNFVKKSSGMTDLDQFRTVNPVNEIVDITETTGPSWVTPGYDAAGSMTTIPKPAIPTGGYTATYDAWHRLVKLTDGSTTVAEYEYDATKQRIVKSLYAGGVLDQRQHFYYNDRWQVVETRREVSGTENANPLAQYVWHPHYVDAILLRDYDSNTDGSAERYYYTQDVNFNVVSILSASGTVLERYGYTPYGQAEVLTASFTPDPDGLSDSDNDITFTGQRLDAESGLMLYRHRFYHSGLGTFCSRDPIGYEGSQWNLYEYVGSFVLGWIDQSGLKSCATISSSHALTGAIFTCEICLELPCDNGTPNGKWTRTCTSNKIPYREGSSNNVFQPPWAESRMIIFGMTQESYECEYNQCNCPDDQISFGSKGKCYGEIKLVVTSGYSYWEGMQLELKKEETETTVHKIKLSADFDCCGCTDLCQG